MGPSCGILPNPPQMPFRGIVKLPPGMGNPTIRWDEELFWDGGRHAWISAVTGMDGWHETLYRTTDGRFFVEHWCDRNRAGSDGSGDVDASYVEWISRTDACDWLKRNGDLPPVEMSNDLASVDQLQP